MTPANLTPAELERWHYVTGNTASAALCALAADGEAAAEDAQLEIDDLTDKVSDLELQLDELRYGNT